MVKKKIKKTRKYKRVKQENAGIPDIKDSIARFNVLKQQVMKKFKVGETKAKNLVDKAGDYDIQNVDDMMYVIKTHLLNK